MLFSFEYSVFQFFNNGKKEISTGKLHTFDYFVSPNLPPTMAEEDVSASAEGGGGKPSITIISHQ